MARTLITNIQVFDGTGHAPFAGEVLIEDNRIARVAATQAEGRIEAADAAVIDGAGATLMPGLIEAHAHLSWPSSIERFIPDFILPPEEQLLATVRNARVLLESGFTSAYSAGALGERIEVVVRNEIEGGWTPGPRLRASTIERSPEGENTGEVDHGR
ncbi:MAG: amidohydrolase, partial [Caulobacter sp.]